MHLGRCYMAATHKTTHPPPRAPVEAGGILTLESRRISEPSELTQHSLFLAAERERPVGSSRVQCQQQASPTGGRDELRCAEDFAALLERLKMRRSPLVKT